MVSNLLIDACEATRARFDAFFSLPWYTHAVQEVYLPFFNAIGYGVYSACAGVVLSDA